MKPAEGNYALCSRARKMIKHILDRVLNAETPYEMPSSDGRASGVVGETETAFDNLGNFSGVSDFPVFGVDMENWFDSVDFGSSWMDTNPYAMGACRSY